MTTSFCIPPSFNALALRDGVLAEAVDAQSVGDYLSDLRDEFGEIVRGHPLAGLKGIEKVLYLLELRFFVQHPQLLSGVQSLPRA